MSPQEYAELGADHVMRMRADGADADALREVARWAIESAVYCAVRDAVAERDALRAALRELRDAVKGLDGPPEPSGRRYARALLEAGRLLGEGPRG